MKSRGPAFPRPVSEDATQGMTLRDYFAGQALIGELAYSPGDADQMTAETAAMKQRLHDLCEKGR